MKKIQLKIAGLSYSQTRAGAYALILEEANGKRRLPVIIGTSEAQSIAIQLEGLKPYRPLTHDLFTSLAFSFKIEILEVNIVKLEEGIFYSEIICKRELVKIHIDSRTSDAVALALRFNAPIYIDESILQKAGIVFEDSEDKINPENPDDKSEKIEDKLTEFSDKELKLLLDEAIENEEYEKASQIRDEIKKRKENK
ncbi:MAG: bifunctional nuclease family protein [Ignavibacteriaceae bacterium]|jgi:bifunctional DNase/RNase|nr:bifunctional nuclease family protein [Ignavibacteriaceae bacterium]